MPQSVRLIDPPAIAALRKPYGTSPSQIYTDTYVQLTPAYPEHKVYFSTDGRDPNPWSRLEGVEERTFKYRGPFRLRVGPRQIKAMSVSRKDKASSRVTTKAFEVIDGSSQRAIIEEVTDEAEDSSTVVSQSSGLDASGVEVLETSDMEVLASRTSPRVRYRGAGRSDVGRSVNSYDSRHSSRSRGSSDVGRSLESYGREAKMADMERDRQRYKDILDNTFLEELHGRRKQDSDLAEKYLTTDVSTSDVDSLFDESYNGKSAAAYGLKHDARYSDDETEVSNYFRSTHLSSDHMATRSPTRNIYKDGDPPAFWSTTTPRVTFPDEADPCLTDRSLGRSMDCDYTPRTRDPVRHSYTGTDSSYNSHGSRNGHRATDNVLSRQTVSDNYHKSPHRGTAQGWTPYTPPRTTMGNTPRGTPRSTAVANRACQGPVSDVGYDAGFSFGRGYRAERDNSPDDWEIVDFDAEFDKAEKEEKKKKNKDKKHQSSGEESDPKSGEESGGESATKEKKRKKKKDKEGSDTKEKSDGDEDGDKKKKKDKDNEKREKVKKKKKVESDKEDKEEDSGEESENGDRKGKKKEKKKKKDKKEDFGDDQKSKANGKDSDNEDKKKKKEDGESGDEKEKKKKKKDKGSDSEDDKKEKKKKKKKDKDSDDSGDDKKKKKKDKDKKKKDDSDTPRTPQTMNRTTTTEPGALSFVNDSGTQINFWGAPPEDVVKKVGQMIVPPGKKGVQAPPFGKESKSRLSPAITFASDRPQTYPPDAEAYPPDTSRTYTVSDSAPIARAQTQQEQHSIGGFFKKLFGKKDKKKEDPQSTVREDTEEASDGNKLTFDTIRQQCLSSGDLWEDPDFLAVDDSVYFNENPADGDIEWRRPSEISDDPQMFVGGASRFDVKQGVLGNCWLLAAVASLTTNEKLLHKVVPPEQNFSDQYAGVFRFKFWQYGKWVEVCIDDRLPTCNGELIFMHSEQGNEFWSPLMEKAYAKLCGCYENLSGGLASEAMTDFTGGVTERCNFQEELPDNMFQMMLKAYKRKSLMGCSIDAAPDEIEQEMDNGLIKGHAYSITAVKVLETDDGPANLVRIRNPWGNDCEWTGAWSDQSDEWQNISEKEKQSMGLQFDHDGEFWMSFKDFSTHFQRLEICHLSPDSLGSDDGSTLWTSKVIHAAWKKNVTAGGCRNFQKTYYTNPQVRVQITDADDDDEEEIGTIIVGLMQKGRRKLRADGAGNLTIGYEVFSTDGKNNKSSLDRGFFKKSKPVATSAYINMREVCTRHRLPPGDYCIVVTTFEPGEEADLLLRIYSEKPGDVVEMDEDTSLVEAKNMSVTQSAPNPGLMKEAERQFQKHGGEDQEIDACELKEIFNTVFTKDFKFGGFDLHLCRSMLAMKDLDHTGKLGLDEFKAMWKALDHWKNIFRKFDEDKSGHLNSCELRGALKHCGYQVSNATYHSVVVRFSDKDGNLQFDDFVACIVKITTMFGIFNSHFKKGQASFSLDDFIHLTIYS